MCALTVTVGATRRRAPVILCICFALLIAACSTADSTPSDIATPVVQPKILATLYLSPTPNDQEREATRLSISVVTSTPQPTRTPQPTAYVGVFVGDLGSADGGVPIVDAARFQGTEAAPFPTLGAPGCAYPVDPVFGTAWTTNTVAVADIGCAGEPVTPYVGTQQIFEHGVMYWIPSGEIWTIAPSGGIDGRFWYSRQAPPDQGWTVPVPEGLRLPQQGFGAVWRAIDGVRQTLGFARLDEQSASISIQRFAGGALIHDSTAGQTFILVGSDTGSAYGPY